MDKDEKWNKVCETIGRWAVTCNHLTFSRIARYNIGTSADTTELVLGPMHLSMHDLREFFEVILQEQEMDPTTALVRFGKEQHGAIRMVAVSLVQMAKDYPQNSLVVTMARLAAKIKKSAEWWRKKVEWNLAETTDPEGLRGPSGAGFGIDLELGIGEATAMIDDWNHNCKLWSLTSTSRFTSMVQQQCSEPTSSLARMARQILALRTFANAGTGMSLHEQSQGQLVFIVSVLEKKCKELGQTAAETQFDKLVAGFRYCAAILRPARNAGAHAQSEGLDDPSTSVSKAKHDFMTKLLKLGQEERDKQSVGFANSDFALKRREVVDVWQYAQESERREATNSNVAAISDKVLRQRVQPWVDLFEDNPNDSRVIERRRQQAAELLDRTEGSPVRPHASKSRKREKRREIDEAFDASSHDVPSEDGHDLGSKRHFGDTNLSTSKTHPVTRVKIQRFGRQWKKREDERKNFEALVAGTLSGFNRAIAENQVCMRLPQEQRWFHPEALEMDENSAAADEPRVEEAKVEDWKPPKGWITAEEGRKIREREDREALDERKGRKRNEKGALAATVEEALDSEEEL